MIERGDVKGDPYTMSRSPYARPRSRRRTSRNATNTKASWKLLYRKRNRTRIAPTSWRKRCVPPMSSRIRTPEDGHGLPANLDVRVVDQHLRCAQGGFPGQNLQDPEPRPPPFRVRRFPGRRLRLVEGEQLPQKGRGIGIRLQVRRSKVSEDQTAGSPYGGRPLRLLADRPDPLANRLRPHPEQGDRRPLTHEGIRVREHLLHHLLKLRGPDRGQCVAPGRPYPAVRIRTAG